MKFSRILLAAFLLALIVPTAKAQMNVGPLKLDPSFANNGKSEVDFEGFNDDATCFAVNLALNRILAAGKVYTSTSGEIRFGVAEYDANGNMISGFGNNGKVELGWTGDAYPNAISLLPNGGVLAVGSSISGSISGYYTPVPTIFLLKADGSIDSGFGDSGISTSFSVGEFETLDTMSIGNGDSSLRYLAMGYGTNTDSDIRSPGYCVARFLISGLPDTAFGSHGTSFVQAPMASVAKGYLTPSGIILVSLLFTQGDTDIGFCKLHLNGLIDSSFGTNGVLNTGIALHGGNWFQSVYDQSAFDTFPGLLVAVPLSDSSAMLPFTIIKFKLDGTLDSNYGQNGIATAPVISNMKIYGMTPPNGKGYTHLCGGTGNVSAAVQFLPGGGIDSTFGTNGIALLDADGGLRKNSLIGFVPSSGKRFIAIGTSVNPTSNDDFLVARYVQGVAGVSMATSEISQPLQVYPNPAHGFVTVESPNGAIEQISVVDALGRVVLSFERPSFASNSDSYFLDVSNIPNGAYNCTIRTIEGMSTQRFTVIH